MDTPDHPVLIAVESSCDESAVAIVRGDKPLAALVSSQEPLHARYGGVVPEVASRNHALQIPALLSRAFAVAGIRPPDLDAVAATIGPGLATTLMVGVAAAKGLAVALAKPFLAVNHLEGHLLSPFFDLPGGVRPAVGLVVSGGHTVLVEIRAPGKYRLLGQTRDDAAGEAFDKVGKLLGLPYPGGPEIDRLADSGDPRRFDFPRAMLNTADDAFSFSGLKTSARYLLPKITESDLPDVCASFREAVVEILVEKTCRAARRLGLKTVAVGGGVSRNSRLRSAFAERSTRDGLEVLMAPPALCTDNAAMIAGVAVQRFRSGLFSSLEEDIRPNLGFSEVAAAL